MDYKLPGRVENSNKRTYGKVLNIAGSEYMPGAAYLSSASALKMGCGYCILITPSCVRASVAANSPSIVFGSECLVTTYFDDVDAVEIGCGLSQNKTAQDLFFQTVSKLPCKTPLIIDADGLNILSKNVDFFKKCNRGNVVLTPHPKEASRLLSCPLEDVLCDIKAAAKKISEKYNCITVLKTHKTYVYSPDGREYTNNTGNNSMAKAGSGDVLTGMISALAAQGMDLFEASALGVYLHGLCGDLAKEKLTEYCVMAEDLISFIPEAVKYYKKYCS